MDTPNNPSTEPLRSPSIWDEHSKLHRELRELYRAGASQQKILAKADQINLEVANLVGAGEVGPEEAWGISAGDNPYIADFEPRDM